MTFREITTYKAIARLRATAPVSWHPATEIPQEHEETGFWALTKVADMTAVVNTVVGTVKFAAHG